ncbi:precorrin-8X/cobalt-precorrin-8 methylmutase [Dehalogenimonas formicexedens]|uniref:Precorrin-8X/cobalt-precorrin-8 methylmutase n=1 Tax=Dehalogenimonas formicexedens TaxID=1839801 RepID=A0A1P8F9H6_9CHLR|nr:precorrin-8X methylmutase [Dehalogenimonas formicexedens]APV45114.1 precorrin-8X/cobalt-precorrin-8 methylmutase [Dehalogenimonas formicexedens]
MTIKTSQPAVIILSHGSPKADSVIPIMTGLCARLKRYLAPGVEIRWAAMQFNHPTLAESAATLYDEGFRNVVVMPYFLYSGQHVSHDIPGMMDEISKQYSDLKLKLAGTLDRAESLIELVAERLGTASPELLPHFEDSAVASRPEDIEALSMEIIEANLPELPFNRSEKEVVKRLIHASGEIPLASKIQMTSGAVDSGIAALRAGKGVFTDVRMVGAGVNRANAEKLGVQVFCALDEKDLADEAKATNQTRSAVAIKRLADRIDGAIVAIGNAPTALYALLDLIDAGQVRPALVIGMPVGFVQAKESKEALVKRDVPYITVRGTRGGSNLAAAAVNALMKLAIR